MNRSWGVGKGCFFKPQRAQRTQRGGARGGIGHECEHEHGHEQEHEYRGAKGGGSLDLGCAFLITVAEIGAECC